MTRPTEGHRMELMDLDLRTDEEQVALMISEHQWALQAVADASPSIVRALRAIVAHVGDGDGRLIYVGTGTAGRIGRLDASEIPLTFSSDRVLAILAGEDPGSASAEHDPEDDEKAAQLDVRRLAVDGADVVLGISASGTTPYTLAALREAQQAGALRLAITSTPGSPLAQVADVVIEVATGPEPITGSTRLKAGTAQKAIVNTLSTLLMVQLGHTYGNLMVDLRATNRKLDERSRRIVMDATGCSASAADRALDHAGDRKVAIVCLLCGVDRDAAAELLAATGGRVRAAARGRTG